MCARWDALARHLTHLDDDDTAHRETEHRAGCPECQAWTPAGHLARDPRDDPTPAHPPLPRDPEETR